MALPTITLITNNIIYGAPENGALIYKYAPFFNLKESVQTQDNTDLTYLTLDVKKAGINIDKPLELNTEVAYDGSVNLIVNDRANPPKLVNSRFYLTSATTYNIADRKGNFDTNIYTEEDFKSETNLIKSVKSIVSVDFLGIFNGGVLPVGNYTFYFKLSDADGNESDFIAESGKVICHMGNINQPKSIRGGQLEENSDKLIKFRLNNLDLAYDYINVYYSRSSGQETKTVTVHKLTDKFKINRLNTEISITGYEHSEELSIDDINVQYTTFNSVKTIETCQNIAFDGNITNQYELFQTLEKYSLFVTPEIALTEDIGNLGNKYDELYPSTGYEYYNAKNVYYKLGYWDQEIYRFGIVYILNDYTLSPVFNIRGIDVLHTGSGVFNLSTASIENEINYQEDFIIQGSLNHNTKGVFKIDNSTGVFNGENPIKPIGLKFNFEGNVLNGTQYHDGLSKLTKGFLIVRQERIPTILAQAVGIGTATKSKTPLIKASTPYKPGLIGAWLAESFLHLPTGQTTPKLGSDFFKVTDVQQNALLCPEASIRANLFNSYFNSSEYKLIQTKYQSPNKIFIDSGDHKQFSLGNLTHDPSNKSINSSLLLIEPGIDSISNGIYDFSSKSGDGLVAYQHADPILGDYEDLETNGTADFNKTTSKLRGEFNSYVGCNSSVDFGTYYNIYTKDYDFENQWKNYFTVRYNDAGPFMPVSNRISWGELVNKTTPTCYRGDCYINTYTHRMNWNFIDSEMPTNKKIVDPYTWYRNFKVATRSTTIVKDENGDSETLTYKKLLPLFTYKKDYIPLFFKSDGGKILEIEAGETNVLSGLLEPDSKGFKKYSEINGLFGAEKINKPDVNAVPLGHWVTFKICSNVNLDMRDLDFSNPMEEAVHKQKRGFYPLQALDKSNSLPESKVLNAGISKTLGEKYYFEIPDVPFIKSNFGTRIYHSLPLQKSAFTNGNRIFLSKNYTDYSMEYGELVKLIEWYGTLIAVMQHGVLMIPVKERAMMTNESGENVYINTDNVLPENPKVLSNTFGSLWADSIIKSSRYIYGIDTVGKKIWRTDGDQFNIISDMKIQKFLNDNINLREAEVDTTVGVNFIKTHYNAFKKDILFVFKYGNVSWHLCWNELTSKWVTRYTWFPEFSENINNIFYTFANKNEHPNKGEILFKHGFAGLQEEYGDINPTKWYDTRYPFEYEFVVAEMPGVQKIFNNLKIISNLTEPESFDYEIVGEGFDWHTQKDLILSLGTASTEMGAKDQYKAYLLANPSVKKLPFIWTRDVSNPLWPKSSSILRDLTIRQHNKTKENLVNMYQKGANMKYGLDSNNRPYGRLRGNMQYLEDSWDIQIQPITFQYAYVSQGELKFSKDMEIKIRDKYIKIRVKYSGTQYAIINALRTLFTISYV